VRKKISVDKREKDELQQIGENRSHQLQLPSFVIDVVQQQQQQH